MVTAMITMTMLLTFFILFFQARGLLLADGAKTAAADAAALVEETNYNNHNNNAMVQGVEREEGGGDGVNDIDDSALMKARKARLAKERKEVQRQAAFKLGDLFEHGRFGTHR
jgi:hypothetical protein